MSQITDDERIEWLEESKRLLLEAADVIDASLHMSGLENRFGDLPDRIREIAESNDEDSIENLIRELKYRGEEHPGWTRPFASPKNITRKDI